MGFDSSTRVRGKLNGKEETEERVEGRIYNLVTKFLVAP